MHCFLTDNDAAENLHHVDKPSPKISHYDQNVGYVPTHVQQRSAQFQVEKAPIPRVA